MLLQLSVDTILIAPKSSSCDSLIVASIRTLGLKKPFSFFG